MKTVIRCAAIAGAVMFAAGSAAWAQGYNVNPGTQGSYPGNPGTQGSYSSNPSTQGSWSSNPSTQGSWSSNPGTQSYTGQGTYNTNQQSTNSGMQGNVPYTGQTYSQAGYGMGNNITTYQAAENELGKYGYSNVHDLRAMQGWSADAMRNGQRVHVIIGDNGMIATFPGR
jgi:hypothetical protein